MKNKFHYAFKVKNIKDTILFYHSILGCTIGRQTENWIDFDFFSHQISAHVAANMPTLDYCGHVDGIKVPIPHFGCILNLNQFEEIQQRLEKNSIQFIVKPQIRYKGKKGEQLTMFVLDFSNNPLEFKCYSSEKETHIK